MTPLMTPLITPSSIRLTVFDGQNEVSEPIATLFLTVRSRVIVQAHLHDDALFAHLHDHVQRVLLWIVQDLDELDQIRVVELLHNGDLFADEVEGIILLPRSRASAARVRQQRSIGSQAPHGSMRPLPENV